MADAVAIAATRSRSLRAHALRLALAGTLLLRCAAVSASGFDAEIFETFVESNMGKDGKPVYYYSTGTVKSFPGGELLAYIEGVDEARLLRRDADGTVHKASRKMYILRDPQTGQVIEQIDGQPNDRYFYPYQYMTFRLDGTRLRGTSVQGSGAQRRSVEIGSAMQARRIGDVVVFSATNARETPEQSGKGSFEQYEFWVSTREPRPNPSTTLTLTLVNWHPIGRGKPVYTHRTSWRVERFEDLPASLRGYIETKAPLYREPPRDMAEIERLQR